MEKEFRIKLTTTDGNLLWDKATSKYFYFNNPGKFYEKLDEKYTTKALAQIAREKGAEVLSYEVTDSGINVTVDWL